MSAHAYTEEQLVEQPAIQLFKELGWTTVWALEETFGATGTLLRETKGEVALGSRLRAALERSPPSAPTARPQTSLGQRPRSQTENIKRAESPSYRTLCANHHTHHDRCRTVEPRRWRSLIRCSGDVGRCPTLVSVGPLALALTSEVITAGANEFTNGLLLRLLLG